MQKNLCSSISESVFYVLDMYIHKCFLCSKSVYPKGFQMVMSIRFFVIYCFQIWISVWVPDEKIQKVVLKKKL